MAWKDLPPTRRALIRGVLFFVVMIVIAIFWNLADEAMDVLLTRRDLFTAGLAALFYVGVMYLLEGRMAARMRK